VTSTISLFVTNQRVPSSKAHLKGTAGNTNSLSKITLVDTDVIAVVIVVCVLLL